MSQYWSKELNSGFEQARKAQKRKSSRMCVHDGDEYYRILRFWDKGFAVDIEDAPKIRGHVQIFDGPRHLYQALVMKSYDEGDERIFEFKWCIPADQPNAVDFERTTPEPKGLLTFFQRS